MKIPYGESNFNTVISGGYVYVDKTAYITQLEDAGKYLFLLRPRRFGKSLFLSMLEYYYDVAYRDQFDTLFGRLAIGQHPTPLRNSYQVLFMDFSGIDTDEGHDTILQRYRVKRSSFPTTRFANSTSIISKWNWNAATRSAFPIRHYGWR
ncbi:MAG: hypothetical protein BWK73_32480 [Thiothrix lacustris]|uniref:AAA-ATPase-like domain-containing protein n=1 Tax=Thiothrix lacustris TaxID=525917 RepID=A0A1Y1QHK1_9GAMM|nr:MAG: hypothetical protein BWK73_32480 [Thiothrix lacustris]